MKRKKLFFLNIVTIFVLVVTTTVLLLTIYSRGNTINNTQVNTLVSIPTVSVPNNQVKFSGEYIDAYLPNNWKLKEYTDKSGMGSITSGGEYSGFTGFSIESPNGTIFQLSGIDGIGGVVSCSQIYKFNDTSTLYIQKLAENESQLGLMEDPPKTLTTQVVDLSNQSYSEIKLFDREGRRIGPTIYWNELNSGNYFNPICGANVMRMKFGDLFFYDHTNKENIYNAAIMKGESEDELKLLDAILNSIKIK